MSNQEARTPANFLRALVGRFGPVAFDLAAHESNAVVRGEYFGPGSRYATDALKASWHSQRVPGSLLFLNPPFRRIMPWVKKCAEEQALGARIALLVPASVCADWYLRHVEPNAYVMRLTPRPFKVEIRDCLLALFTPERYVGSETWRWIPAG